MTIFKNKVIQPMEVLISKEDKELRIISEPENTNVDYLDDEIRRLFPINGKHEYENKVFENTVAICLTDIPISITIKNCEFKKDLFIRFGKEDKDYTLFIYKCNIVGEFSTPSFEAKNDIAIDTCVIEKFNITGKSNRIDLYGSKINLLAIENEKCESFNVLKSEIKKYALYKFNPNEVEFDTDDLAISDYKRFDTSFNQTERQVSELYHRIVLKTAKSIKSTREINYELTKATSNWTGFLFGYFYKPLYVVIWMTAIVFLFSMIYELAWSMGYDKSLYFSVYTFLTIGFGDIATEVSMLKTILVFIEGMLGIVYTAALLTSIINSSKK